MANAPGSLAVATAILREQQEQELITGEAVALELRPTSFVLRAAGAMIDCLVYLGGYILVMILSFQIFSTGSFDAAAFAAYALSLLVLFIVALPTAVEMLSHGKSLGRLAVGARIVRDDGGAIGFRHAFIRSLTGVLDIFLTFGGLAAIVALLNGRTKRLGDLLAGSYSQYERVSKEAQPLYGVPVELREWATTADVGRMPDRLTRRISQFLQQAAQFTPATRVRLSRELAAEASVWVSPVPQIEAELFLAAVAVLRREREAEALRLERDGLENLAGTLRGLPHGFPDRP